MSVSDVDYEAEARRPIGVFDSGLGGLTVVRELLGLMPAERIVYLGDSARVPYGIKSLQTVRRFAMEDASFLMRLAPKLIVVACNTASAAAISQLQATLPVPVVDVIRPGSAAAVAAAGPGTAPIGVMATEATVASGAYQRELAELAPAREVIAVACPLLVPIVEEGRPEDDPIVMHVLCDYLREMQRRRPAAMILGCTHYPLLAGAIGKLMGPDVPLVCSGRAAAMEARRQLLRANLASPDAAPGVLECYTTDNPGRFTRLARRFGGREADSVCYVGTDELEGPAGADARADLAEMPGHE